MHGHMNVKLGNMYVSVPTVKASVSQPFWSRGRLNVLSKSANPFSRIIWTSELFKNNSH